ncbi:MAG: hypothetical protein K8T25_07125 [Planctomycetia bacterium]|nr:hypothetical protein [Planctomycetia bacterium]
MELAKKSFGIVRRYSLALSCFCTAMLCTAMAFADPAPVELNDLGDSVDVSGLTIALGTKIGTYWALCLVVVFALCAVGWFVNYMLTKPKRAAK